MLRSAYSAMWRSSMRGRATRCPTAAPARAATPTSGRARTANGCASRPTSRASDRAYPLTAMAARRLLCSPQFGQAGEDLAAGHRQVGDGVGVIEKGALPHHQEMPEPADMVVERL